MKTFAIAAVATLALAGAATLGMALGAPIGDGSGATTWAVMITGFGAAGSIVRRRREGLAYRLVERSAKGVVLEEEFAAPDDTCALARAASVASGEFKLWRGDTLVAG